ncbi:MAG: hypothetical protein E7319_05310 [Clostridiales bacterium]|nr:hypothetical protein [Clostridiales bacterium]
MTVDELSVRISVAADEALETLDGLSMKVQELTALLKGQQTFLLDTAAADESLGRLREALAGMEDNIRQRSESFAQHLGELFGGVSSMLDRISETDVNRLMDQLSGGVEGASGVLSDTAAAAQDASGQLNQLGDASQDVSRQLQRQQQTMQGLNSRIDQLGRQRSALNTLKNLTQQLKQTDRSSEAYAATVLAIQRYLRDAGVSVDRLGDDFSGLDHEIGAAEQSINVSASSMYGHLGALVRWAHEAGASLNISGSVSVDTDGAIASLNGLIAAAQAAQAILAALGVAGGSAEAAAGTGRVGGGGGGGRNKEEEARRAAEEARQEAIRWDYELIDHKRHMNEITLEEEIEMLEALRRKHALTTEEIMEWEERVYDVRQDILRRDQENLDRLTQGVVQALSTRYETMRDEEEQRLESSRQAWESWRDDSVRAIEDQIAALERLADTEDREAKDAEELRKIEKLRRDVAYEQDDYNRMKLEEQLQQAIQSREERLRRQELTDRKDALEQEKELIEQRADEEIAVLDRQQEELQAAYEQRLKQAALEAEAEKLILAGSQQEILDLLSTYVPEYDLLGRTMGERLLEGFQSAVGNIVGWFGALGDELASMQSSVMESMGAAASAFYGGYGERAQAGSVTVNQTVTFNQPMESPGDVARRMEQVNQELGALMGQEG